MSFDKNHSEGPFTVTKSDLLVRLYKSNSETNLFSDLLFVISLFVISMWYPLRFDLKRWENSQSTKRWAESFICNGKPRGTID